MSQGSVMGNLNTEITLDLKARKQALDHTKSYIVQAPAGSGKTELLTQRVLNLLNHVNRPEEIIALTFTRKAAAEMRERIICALCDAHQDIKSLKEHQLTTYNLAKAVLKKNDYLGWELLSNPARLNITTIDSLCAKIINRMPILSQIGGEVTVSDTPQIYYEKAIDEVFKLVNTDDEEEHSNREWAHDFSLLLKHFGCNYRKLKDFLLEMLYKREQWLPYMVNVRLDNENMDELADLMQYCWHELSSDVIKLLSGLVSLNYQVELDDLLQFAAKNLSNFEEINSTQEKIIKYDKSNLSYWQAISYLLLSADESSPSFRKRLDKRIGFPSKTDAANKEEQDLYVNKKNMLLNIINDLTLSPDVAGSKSLDQQLIKDFCLLRSLPSFNYSHENWDLLKILANILTLLEAQLRIIFKENKTTDFSGVTQGALYALGTTEQPSDLNLWFDYHIQHILIDEFQDTSYSQFQLLTKLTANWVQNETESKTLFLVGDPMQSIYRFRQADVGLFLQVKDYGIGDIKLDFLQLNQNFRSGKQIVDWVNDKFAKIFPVKSNNLFGAVSYSKSCATIKSNDDLSPKLHLFDRATTEENDYIVQKILQLINERSQAKEERNKISIAVLVRNRRRVGALVSALKKQDITVNAVNIESLSDKMVIKDLLSLTLAILNLYDHTSWLSVLRAPWCGLGLADLYKLRVGNEDKSLYHTLLSNNLTDFFDAGSLDKIKNIIFAFGCVFTNLYKIKFYKIVKQAWHALGGHLIYTVKQDIDDAEQFFNLLFTLEEANYIQNKNRLIDEVGKLYSTKTSDENITENACYTLDVMTIHKSKGLEFDYVILPYLDQGSRGNDHQLLLWQQYHNESMSGILMAPYYLNDNEQAQFYNSLRYIEQQKEGFELCRLFYVAVTRSRDSCILTASLDFDKLLLNNENLEEVEATQIKVNSNSMLAKLLNNLDRDEYTLFANRQQYYKNSIQDINHYLYYIEPDSFDCASLISSNNLAVKNRVKDLIFREPLNDNPKIYLLNSLATETSRVVGIFVHKLFYNIASRYLNADLILDSDNNINPVFQSVWRNGLLSYGVSLAQINTAMEQVTTAVKNILQDPVGRWILSDFNIGFAEQEFYYYANNKSQKSIIDRLFIDDQTIWVVDYKIGESHDDLVPNSGENQQINVMEVYTNQLNHYGFLVKKYFAEYNNYEVRLGLYFPLTKKFISWDYIPHSFLD